jgi:hypothetical protein
MHDRAPTDPDFGALDLRALASVPFVGTGIRCKKNRTA